jgi:membrane protein implicated in regulation of membrane protease activity
LFDWVFAFFHLLLLAGVVGYAIFSLVSGNILRFGILFAGLSVYYVLVLHKPVRREIERKRGLKRRGDKASKT